MVRELFIYIKDIPENEIDYLLGRFGKVKIMYKNVGHCLGDTGKLLVKVATGDDTVLIIADLENDLSLNTAYKSYERCHNPTELLESIGCNEEIMEYMRFKQKMKTKLAEEIL